MRTPMTSRSRLRSICGAATLAVSLLTPPRAAAAPAPAPAPAVAEVPGATTAPASWLTLSGFVDASLSVPFEEDPDVLLGLDQVELDAVARPADGLTLRVDVNFFPAEAAALDDRIVEQGFVEYFFEGGDEGVFLAAGKRNAPVGVEAVDPTDMYQFSHGLLFDFASPTNLTGFFLGWTGGGATVTAWATNDWDTATTAESASAGGRVAYDFGAGTVGLSGTYGPFEADDPRTMLDLDLALVFGDALLWFEGNFGRVGDENSYGVLVKAHYAITAALGATLRWDWLDRPFDGLDNRSSATGAFLFAFDDHFGGLVEVRADFFDWGDDPDVAAALELTAKF